jgi:hypothetical protein
MGSIGIFHVTEQTGSGTRAPAKVNLPSRTILFVKIACLVVRSALLSSIPIRSSRARALGIEGKISAKQQLIGVAIRSGARTPLIHC